MSKTINYALIGCGRIAGRHIEAIQASNNSKLIAVADLDLERAKEKGTQGDVPFYQNYHTMLEQHPEIDIVTILTSSGMHYEHAKDILMRYRKHLLIEKPLVLNLKHGIELKQLAESLNKRIFPVYQNRFNKAVQHVKQALSADNKALGDIRVGTVRVRWCRPQRYYNLSDWRGTYAMDGGALTNQGVHYLDILRYLCGNVKRVNAKLATLGADIEAEDTAVAILEFESGALGVIEIMTSARHDDFEASVSVVGSEGLAVISGIATNELHVFSINPTDVDKYSEEFPTVYGLGHNVIINGVSQALLENKTAPIEYNDGLETIKLLHAIYRSDEIKDWVEVDQASSSSRLGVPDDRLARPYRILPENKKKVLK